MALMHRATTITRQFHWAVAGLEIARQPPSPSPSRPSQTARYLSTATKDQLGTASNRTKREPHSRHHYEERLVPFTQKQLFDVVANVDEYKNFVPWCTSSNVSKRVDDTHLIADLSVGFTVLSENYTSVITLKPNESVSADVPNSNLFEYLVTDWKFRPTTTQQTRLSFYVEFAFRNPVYQRATDLFFEEVVRQMVGAFERQCSVKYRFPETTPGILHRW